MARVEGSRPAFTAMSAACSRRLALGVLAAAPWSLCRAQPHSRWPTGPVTIVVPAPPGGVLDAFIRQLAESLGADLGQRFLVNSRAGAGGLIAAREGPRTAVLIAVYVVVSAAISIPYLKWRRTKAATSPAMHLSR